MIRSFEQLQSEYHSPSQFSPSSPSARTTVTKDRPPDPHVPIFAVSASLVEQNRNHYTETGFDGWILKPIDFENLKCLLTGIFDQEVRTHWVYTPGKWERGGWFTARQQFSGGPTSAPPFSPPPPPSTSIAPLAAASTSSTASSGQPTSSKISSAPPPSSTASSLPSAHAVSEKSDDAEAAASF